MPRPADPQPRRWWLAFNLVADFPEENLAGRYHRMANYTFGLILLNSGAVSEWDRNIYANAYSSAEPIRVSKAWFPSRQQEIEDFYGYVKVAVPVSRMGCGGFFECVRKVPCSQGVDVRVVEVQESLNYLAEVQLEAVISEFVDFFG